jgi:hypothetical protein
MRKIFFVLSILLLCSSISYATDCNDFYDAEEIIKDKCNQKYPDDFSMQKFCIDDQVKNVKKLEKENVYDIPSDVFDGIREKCCDKWNTDYSMRVFCESEQSKKFTLLENYDYSAIPYDVEETIKSKCINKWAGDYGMQKFCIDQQIKAWLELNP